MPIPKEPTASDGQSPADPGNTATAGNPPTTPDPAPPAGLAEPEAKFTQADLDRIIAARLAPLKEKADAYDKAQEAAKTEAERQADARQALEAELAGYKAAEARRQAVEAANLPPEVAGLVTGSTAEQIAASVEQVKEVVAKLTGPRTPRPDKHQGLGPSIPAAPMSVAQVRQRQSEKYRKQT